MPPAPPARLFRSRRWAWLVVAFASGTALAQAAGVAALGWARVAVDQGEAWRLLTAGFVHLSAAHWATNVAGWAAVLAVWGPWVGERRLAALGLALAPLHLAVAQAAGLLDWGAGFSGPLHGMVAAAGIELTRHDSPRLRRAGRATLAGLAAKLAADLVLDAHAAGPHDFPVAHALHWTAVAVALLGAAAFGPRRVPPRPTAGEAS